MYRLSAKRMVRAGVRPSAEAAAIRLVVLNGTGGATVRLRFVMDSTRAEVWPSTWAITALASASALKRAVA